MAATIGTKLFTWINGNKAGEDQFGNRYYEAKKKIEGERTKRWVIYNGKVEPSKIPALWHGWLHYTNDKTASEINDRVRYDWEQEHIPNLTGTKHAYFQEGHERNVGDRAKSDSDYQAWDPTHHAS